MSTQEHEATAEKALGHAHASGTCLLARDVAAALADAVRVAREEDCKAVCPGCAQGTPLDGPWHKGSTCTLDIRGGSGLCRATEIRARAGEGDATAIRPHPFYQDALPREKGLCDYTELNGDGCAEPPESTIHQEGGASAKPTNRWGIEPDEDTPQLGKMSGGLSMPVKLEGDATPGPEPECCAGCYQLVSDCVCGPSEER